jgi:hypothetical protein
MTIRARTNTLVFPTVFTFTNAINGIAIESKSKSEEEAERKENVNIEAVINTDNVQNETRKRKISENICSKSNPLFGLIISISVSSSSFTSFSSKDNLSQQLQFILPHFSHTHSHGSLSQFEQGQTHGSL